jgi:hypothetical protein
MEPQHEGDRGTWSMPQNVMVGSIMVIEHGRLPIDEAVVKDIMATIGAGDMSALPPIHLWRKQPGGNPILVAGRNRLEAHKRCDCEVISARVITGETPEIVRAVQLIELDETPAFIDAHAKQTGRHRATIARGISEAEKIGDDVMRKIIGTSLDKKSEITALAAMDEQERQEIVDRAVAGEKVSAAEIRRKAKIRNRMKQSACDCNPEDPGIENPEPGDTPEAIPDRAPLQAGHSDAAAAQAQAEGEGEAEAEAYARWLLQYETVNAKQAALAQELEDLMRRIEEVDGEARRVNEAKPFTSHEDGCPLSDTVARADGLSIMNLKLPARTGASVPASPPSPLLSVQLAAMMAAIPMPAIGPEQINARNAALMREENQVFSRYVADQLNHRAREAAEARAQEELRRRRAGGH